MKKTEINALKVLLYDKPIGTLTYLPGDTNLFTWDEDYIEDLSRPTLSLSFQDTARNLIQEIPMTRTQLPAFFSNLLPEGLLREYLAKRANINPKHEFFLLWILGQDLPGAITVQPLDRNGALFLPNSDEEINKKKRETLFRFSLAGVQLKFLGIQRNEHGLVIPVNGIGGDWIIKLPHSIFRGVPENEYTMMELARKVGIDVPEVILLPIEQVEGMPKELDHLGENIFAIKRFDRTQEGHKIHIEDFAQVFGVYPEKKYQKASYRNIAEIIWKECGELGISEFIRRFVFNALIGNGDMHLKNWSLIYREKNKAMLAPAYDFVSTILYLPDDRLALNFMHSKDFKHLTIDQFKRFSAKAQLPEKLVLSIIEETVERFSVNWKTVKDLPLKKELREAIDQHLKTIPLYTLQTY